MDNCCQINVKTIQRYGHDQDSGELHTEGSIKRQGDTMYIDYQETEISGMEGTMTSIKIDTDKVTLIRYGSIESRMVFKLGTVHKSSYRTMYGDLDLEINTKVLSIDRDEKGIHIHIVYDVAMGDSESYESELQITVRDLA